VARWASITSSTSFRARLLDFGYARRRLFDERVAASYDRAGGEEFAPALIETTVDFLVEVSEPGARSNWESGRAGSRFRSRGA